MSTPQSWYDYAASALEREKFQRRVVKMGNRLAAELTALLGLPGAYVVFDSSPTVVFPEPRK